MKLEGLIEQASRRVLTAENGHQQAATDGLLLLRQDAPSSLEASLYQPVLCLILQGRKQVSIGEQTLSFGPGECLLVSHDLPVRSRVTKAPYLALVFEVNVATIRRLYDQVAESPLDSERARAAVTHRADPGLLDALHRYLALADSPADVKVLGPLISSEIHYRLLVAPFGGMLRSLIRQDSNASAIARAIGHIRDDIRSPIAIPDLARQVGMSASSFHKHFKAVTSTTPLQYQKELRLLEARRLLKTSGASATNAAYEVDINIVNRGISGNTVVDLRNRWHEDVLQHAPEWLSVKIGINDLNRHLGGQVPSFPDPEGFREIYDQLLGLTRKTLPETEILLIAPFLITRDVVPDSNRRKSLDLLEKYLAAVKDLAKKYKTRFLNLHPIFQERIKHHHPDVYCPEPVHPNWTGHLLIAEEVYRVLTLP